METTIAPFAEEILSAPEAQVPSLLRSALEGHRRIVANKGPGLRKDAPESAVTIVKTERGIDLCVKELRWRGTSHAMKGWFRPTQGLRTYRNGLRLRKAGIGVATPLALMREKSLGLVTGEWVVMQVVPAALELDRHIVSRSRDHWSVSEKRRLARDLGLFLGKTHGLGIAHSDLKTCNIMVTSEGAAAKGGGSGVDRARGVDFHLLDYDDVYFGAEVSWRSRVKNLVQIFLSTPTVMTATDRMRFLRAYSMAAGLDVSRMRGLARAVLGQCEGRDILYVGFEGDVVERWR